MITQKQVDQIINVGRVYIPDEKPFKQVFKKAFPLPIRVSGKNSRQTSLTTGTGLRSRGNSYVTTG